MSAILFDDRPCLLGEGAFWHPTRLQFFWFDILGKRLLSRDQSGAALEWRFGDYVSAAGWVDDDRLLIASSCELFEFDLRNAQRRSVIALEDDTAITRSNDGRADPWGGFWIGTMGIDAQPNAGAIYRYYRGELQVLYPQITISNAICFSPDRKYAYFCDTPTRQIMRQALDHQGWPKGPPELFIDLTKDGYNPDGAVIDAQGNLWNAQWGASRVACYNPDGEFITAYPFPARQISCPAFGGAGLADLFATSASDGVANDGVQGCTFTLRNIAQGQAEHQVIL